MGIPAGRVGVICDSRVSARLLVVVSGSAAIAAVDIIVSVLLQTPSWAYHHRSAGWVALCLVLLVASAALTVIHSWAVAVGAASFSGGILGNLIAASWNNNYVPNPLLLGNGYGGVAFNPADVFILAGIVLLTGAFMVISIRNADRFPASTAADRWLKRRLRL